MNLKGMSDDNKERDDQNDQDGRAQNKVEGTAAELDATSRDGFSDFLALHLEALLFALNALLTLLLRFLHFTALVVSAGAQVFHAAAHLAIVGLRLLVARIRGWSLLGLG